MLLAVWPVPQGHTGQVVDPRDKNQDWVEVKDLVAAGLLTPGTTLTPRQGNWRSCEALIRDIGTLEVEGQSFGSPSGAGRHVKGSVTNGWTFWSLPDGGDSLTYALHSAVRSRRATTRPLHSPNLALPNDRSDCAEVEIATPGGIGLTTGQAMVRGRSALARAPCLCPLDVLPFR
ncbi:hypothetical protein [Nocardia sp. PE-7]|uniref:restriction system modified-DNA reader domain-containing protein n=1 Tax=Nocardia sp. PE-7 TaxID=3058426 RepID=UPI003462BCBA